ncbi:unannotated protein [freshwater metagenome]|uniref:Unannotated protein n=1 Tax=freshwater metagenome TaxID=449393 RepID=A0A6J5YGF6_9ZZZZ
MEDRMLRRTGGSSQLFERGCVVVVTADVGHARDQALECGLIPVLTAFGDRGTAVFVEVGIGPVVASHTDHVDTETAPAFEPIDGREELLLGEVSRGAEQDQ